MPDRPALTPAQERALRALRDSIDRALWLMPLVSFVGTGLLVLLTHHAGWLP